MTLSVLVVTVANEHGEKLLEYHVMSDGTADLSKEQTAPSSEERSGVIRALDAALQSTGPTFENGR